MRLQAKVKSLQVEVQQMVDKDDSSQKRIASQDTEIANLNFIKVSL